MNRFVTLTKSVLLLGDDHYVIDASIGTVGRCAIVESILCGVVNWRWMPNMRDIQ